MGTSLRQWAVAGLPTAENLHGPVATDPPFHVLVVLKWMDGRVNHNQGCSHSTAVLDSTV
jgi:hypothetical protein